MRTSVTGSVKLTKHIARTQKKTQSRHSSTETFTYVRVRSHLHGRVYLIMSVYKTVSKNMCVCLFLCISTGRNSERERQQQLRTSNKHCTQSNYFPHTEYNLITSHCVQSYSSHKPYVQVYDIHTWCTL